MVVCSATDYDFPAMPYAEWKDTKDTLHLFAQIVGKVRLKLHPKLNHWWHVTMYVSPEGLTTERIPVCGKDLEIEFNFLKHELQLRTSDGNSREFSLPGLSVAEFYQSLMYHLERMIGPVEILAKPYDVKFKTPFPEDKEPRPYDAQAVARYWQVLLQIDSIFEEFRGRFLGKASPVHKFWHSFDLAFGRYSGRSAPPRDWPNPVEKEAYSHEVIAFGFWPGDDSFPQPAFYSYTYPEPQGLPNQPLQPEGAFWQVLRNSHYAFLMYEDLQTSPDPRRTLLDFLESAYQAGATLAKWPIQDLKLVPA